MTLLFQVVKQLLGNRTMKCQRCLRGEEATHRVYTDVMDIKVCAACADEARELHIGIEVLETNQRTNERADDYMRQAS
jgi:hypothetical protein